MSRVLLVLLCATLAGAALAGCDQDRNRQQATLQLERCRLPGVDSQARCGRYEVWEDRAAKAGRKLSLHVAVLPALAARPEPDPLFILAGGPGQSASGVARLLAPALERVRRKRDLVFVDQRGTGRSAPLECDLEPTQASLTLRLRADLDEAAVQRCAQALSATHDLRHYGTAVAMEDLDEVRAALGYGKINLWGASYGTRAALVYLRRHPARVRVAILDGVAPLSLVLPKDMAKDGDRALRLLFSACAEDDACDAAWPRLGARFDALMDRLAQAPARVEAPHPVTGETETVEVDRDAFARILRVLLYQPEATSLVPLTIDRAEKGDFRPFLAQSEWVSSGFSKDVAVGMFLSVVCTEDAPYLEEAELRRAAEGTFLGPGFALDVLRSCRAWPKGKVPDGFREPVRSEVPVLLLSGELDPVTPPRWAEEARAHLPNARHLVLPATGHGTLGNACVRRLIERFVEQGTTAAMPGSCDEVARPPFFVDFAGPTP
jgi:pimeloyl-ACP methyl ester carboxylesterase